MGFNSGFKGLTKKHEKLLPEVHEYSGCAIVLTGVSSGKTQLSPWRDAVKSGRNLQTFRRNVLHPSSWYKGNMCGKVSGHDLAEAEKHTTHRVSQCETVGPGQNAGGTPQETRERQKWVVEVMEHNATASCSSSISVPLISVPWKKSQYFPSKRRKHSTRLHGVVSPNTILFTVTTYTGAHGSAVGWGTTLQVGRSQFRFPMVSLEFFIDIILPAVLWPWGWLNL